MNPKTRMSFRLAAALLACVCAACSADRSGSAAKAAPAAPMADRLDQLQECSLDAARRAGELNAATYARRLVELGHVDELRKDAQAVARKELARYNDIAPPSSEEGRARNYLAALTDVSFVDSHSEKRQLKARAYLAYYESKFTGDECPLDADILQLINKTTT